MFRTPLAAFCVGQLAGLLAVPAVAADGAPLQLALLDPIVVTATRFETADVDATYASEVHSREMIEQSGAMSLYDYLARHSSINVLPSYGNRYAPKIDMRGYGIGDGYQNVVVSLDGHRLNNLDMSTQLLGAIPLSEIERIEITKGSGSVMYGDGATAGSMQVITRQHSGMMLRGSLGTAGERNATLTAGVRKERISLSASADYSHLDGYSDADVSGHKDASSNQTWRGNLEVRPADRLKLGLDLASSRIDTRYVGYLSQADFSADPQQNGGNTYSWQKFETDTWRVRADLALSRDWHISASHGREDKLSEYVSSSWVSNYAYRSDDLALQYQAVGLALTLGVQDFEGTRSSGTDRTDKRNTAWYAQSQYQLGDNIFSAGLRQEQVDYSYAPASGASLDADHRLLAWDLGINRRVDDRLSLFANYDRAFQAPDIDRFFSTDFNVYPAVTSFNAFIKPAISHTLNLGLNHVGNRNRLKFTLFHARLDNEIYYYSTGPWSGYNTNLAKTHKYGLELQDNWRISEPLSITLNYAYVRARIDRQGGFGSAYDDKNLPGVPRHGLSLGLNYQPASGWNLNLTQVWRSSAYAANDFANNFTQRQAAYQSTDFAVRYQHRNLEASVSVENLFAHKNGLWIQDDVIYPVDFSRRGHIGLKASF